jgi:deoxyribonuclease-4
MPVGIHIDSNIKNILNSLKLAYKFNAKVVQFFVNTCAKDKDIYDKLKILLKKYKITSIVHISYTINCSRNWDENSWWINQFIDEIELSEYIGAKYCVVHLGKQLELSIEESINNMYTSLLYVHNKTKNANIKILLETSSGQGTEIAYKLEDLGYLFRKFSQNKNSAIVHRFGICIDTCHIFSAGYNIVSREARKMYFETFNKLIGLNYIKLLHLNDSKVICGAKIDRHENIGKGYIKEKPLYIIAKFFSDLPIVLETPYENIFKDLKKILKYLK